MVEATGLPCTVASRCLLSPDPGLQSLPPTVPRELNFSPRFGQGESAAASRR